MTSASETLSRTEHETILDQTVGPLHDKIEYQKHTIEKLQKALYGSKSDKVIANESGEHQADLFIEEPSEPAKEEEQVVKEHRRRKPRTPRFPDDAEREIVDVELEGSERECGSCGKELQDIGYESSEQAHVIPARVQIREIRRHKYACACKQSGVQIAPVQPSAFPKTQITDETRAHFLVQKYVDHLPYYRQSKILKRDGIEIPDCSMSRYGLESADALAPILLCMKAELLASGYLQVDETSLRVLGARESGSHLGWLWAYGAPKGMIVFEYQHGRGAEHPARFLQEYSGVLQTDRYAGYFRIQQREDVIDIGCWAHARRKFVEAQSYAGKRTKPILSAISKLYGVERDAREHAFPPDQRQRLRQKESVPVLQHIRSMLEVESIRVLPTSPLGKAIEYSLSNWASLARFVDHGQVEIDNNLVENSIRPIAIGRKNYMFAGSEGGAEASAIIYSLTESCRRLRVNPRGYLCDVFRELPYATTTDDFRRLTPRRWLESRN